MPTQEKIDWVKRQIEWMKQARFEKGYPTSGSDGETWSQLSEYRQLALIDRFLDWDGFDIDQKAELMVRAVNNDNIMELSPESFTHSDIDIKVTEEIGSQPGHFAQNVSFDIHGPDGKIGRFTGDEFYSWHDPTNGTEFFMNHIEMDDPDRQLSPGQWLKILRDIPEYLPDVAMLIGSPYGEDRVALWGSERKVVRIPIPSLDRGNLGDLDWSRVGEGIDTPHEAAMLIMQKAMESFDYYLNDPIQSSLSSFVRQRIAGNDANTPWSEMNDELKLSVLEKTLAFAYGDIADYEPRDLAREFIDRDTADRADRLVTLSHLRERGSIPLAENLKDNRPVEMEIDSRRHDLGPGTDGTRRAAIDASAHRHGLPQIPAEKESLMPTRDQMDAVTRQIEDLMGERFRPVDGEMKPAGSDAPNDSLTWKQLNFEQSLEALHYGVDWSGFTVEQQVEVSLRVVDGEPSSEWMGNIEASDQREHAAAFHRERQEDRWVGEHGRLPMPEELRQDAAETRAAWDIAPPAPAAVHAEVEPGEPRLADEDAAALSREVKLRELFDLSNRVMADEYIRKNAAEPTIATKSADMVREVYIREAEKTWGSFREEGMFRTDAEIDEAMELFRQKDAAHGPAFTLMDGLRQGIMSADHSAATADPVRDPDQASIRPLTKELIECCQLDVWPGMATVVDFGIDSSSHLGALQFAIRGGLVTPAELDAAMGSGEKLTEIGQRGDNPYRDVTFKTSWDGMRPDPEDNSPPGGSEPGPARTEYDRRLQEAAEHGMSLPRDPDRGRDR